MSTKTRAYNISYARVLFIDREISKGHFPSAPKLAKQYEVSESTIKRDITYMRDSLECPIEYHKSHKGYYYTEPNFMLPAVFTDKNGILAAAIVLKMLSQCSNAKIFDDMKSIFNKSYNNIFTNDSRNKELFDKRIVMLPNMNLGSIEPNAYIWEQIINAMYENRLVHFTYEDDKSYIVAPYQVIFKENAWYLVGCEQTSKKLEFYLLSKLQNLQIPSDKFVFPKDYKYISSQESVQSLLSNEQLTTCRIKFFGDTKDTILEKDYNISFDIDENDDFIILTFQTDNLEKVVKFILGEAGNAIPLEPQSLVNMWKDRVATMNRRIEDDKNTPYILGYSTNENPNRLCNSRYSSCGVYRNVAERVGSFFEDLSKSNSSVMSGLSSILNIVNYALSDEDRARTFFNVLRYTSGDCEDFVMLHDNNEDSNNNSTIVEFAKRMGLDLDTKFLKDLESNS